MRTVRAAIVSLLASAAVASGAPAVAAPPGPVWPEPDFPVADPASLGLDPARLTAAVEHAFTDTRGRSLRTQALVVVHHGRIVAERYAPGVGPVTPLLGWSMTKTVTNALVGVLVRDGRLAVGAPADVAGWRAPGDPRGAITLDHLLRMSSGLAWSEDYGLAGIFRVGTLQMLLGDGRRDMAAYAADRPLADPPGTRFLYASGTSLILSGLVRHAVGGTAADYHAFPARALFGPLGMRTAVLETDGAGTFVGSSYMYASARDWARFGLLYLRDGVWAGRRILPEGWVDYTRTPAPAAPHGEYGAHVWLLDGVTRRDRDPERARALPLDAFYAAGRHGQYVAVVPSLDLVAVRLGLPGGSGRFRLPALLADLTEALPR